MTRIHAIGDSWTCREEDTGLDRGWQAMALLPEHRHGVSGTTAKRWAHDDGRVLSSALATMRSGDKVIVSLLGNDLRHAMADGLTLSEIGRAALDLHRVVRRIKSHRCRPILLLYADPHRGRNATTTAGVALMRLILRTLARLSGCGILDTAAILRDEHFLPGPGIHPTEAGHRAIANHILKHGDNL